MPVKKSIRFEIFKRDSFTCQYCGKSAPSAILELDHIQPVSKGGDDELTNLITSCQDCNSGKSNRELSDDAIVQKRKAQLDELQERREQIEMMLEWQCSLENLEGVAVDQVATLWSKLVPNYFINDNGRISLKKLIKRFGLDEIMESLRASAIQYLQYDAEHKLIPESVHKTYEYIERIAYCRRRDAKKPYMKELYQIRATMRYQFNFVNEWLAIHLLERAYLKGIDVDELRQLVYDNPNWSSWRCIMEEWLE